MKTPMRLVIPSADINNGMTEKHGHPLHFLKPAGACGRNYIMLLGLLRTSGDDISRSAVTVR